MKLQSRAVRRGPRLNSGDSLQEGLPLVLSAGVEQDGPDGKDGDGGLESDEVGDHVAEDEDRGSGPGEEETAAADRDGGLVVDGVGGEDKGSGPEEADPEDRRTSAT